MELKIRKAEWNDLTQINKIAKQVHDLHVEFRPDIFLPCDIVISEKEYKTLLDDDVVFVGEIDERIVSYAVCLIKNADVPILVSKKILFIDSLGNDKDFMKCGIGKKMMNHIFTYAKEMNCDKVELQVIERNKNAVDFYKHLGMAEKIKTLEINL